MGWRVFLGEASIIRWLDDNRWRWRWTKVGHCQVSPTISRWTKYVKLLCWITKPAINCKQLDQWQCAVTFSQNQREMAVLIIYSTAEVGGPGKVRISLVRISMKAFIRSEMFQWKASCFQRDFNKMLLERYRRKICKNYVFCRENLQIRHFCCENFQTHAFYGSSVGFFAIPEWMPTFAALRPDMSSHSFQYRWYINMTVSQCQHQHSEQGSAGNLYQDIAS